MKTPSTKSGGLFLMLAIVSGTAWGMTTGQVMLGVLSGTGAGMALALLVWVLDRRRSND